MEPILDSNSKTARLAGLLFYIISIPASAWGLFYVPSKIFVLRDATATANNLLLNEFLFRTGIVSHFVSTIAACFIVLLLYRLFRPVNKDLSRMMVVPVLAQVPIVFVVELFKITALMVLKGGALIILPIMQKQEFCYLLLRMHGYGIASSQLFWGLYFIPFGMLAYRSRFAPRIIGVLLIITGIGYVGDTCAFILLQRPHYLIIWPYIRLTFLGNLLAMLWFLVMGVREQRGAVKKPN